MKQKKGFGPSTCALATHCSTTELLLREPETGIEPVSPVYEAGVLPTELLGRVFFVVAVFLRVTVSAEKVTLLEFFDHVIPRLPADLSEGELLLRRLAVVEGQG